VEFIYELPRSAKWLKKIGVFKPCFEAINRLMVNAA
jgi:hypothetical protein